MAVLPDLRRAATTARLYGSSAARVALRRKRALPTQPADRPIFVVGSPRSGTTFLAGALGAHPGVVDLDEVNPLKALIPSLIELPEEQAAAKLRRTLELVRGLGLARGLRPVEQTPETSFVLAAALRAYPGATAVHIVRDGRDVACSLIERGWLRAGRGGADDAQQAYGAHPRFWVEPDRREEFAAASEATRAAWAWRRYVTAVRTAGGDRVVEVRYEDLAADPRAAAARLAEALGLDALPLEASLGRVHGQSVGRWRSDLSPDQLADVEREAGDLLRALGY